MTLPLGVQATTESDEGRSQTPKWTSNSNSSVASTTKSQNDGRPNDKLLAGVVFVAAATVANQDSKNHKECRRTQSHPISRNNSATQLPARGNPQRKFGEARRRDEVQHLAPKKPQNNSIGLHNVAAAKILGRTWQHSKKRISAKNDLVVAAQVERTPSKYSLSETISENGPPPLLKKKYKKKKHSLSSPSLGKYSPLLLRKAFQQRELCKVEDEGEADFTLLWDCEEDTRTLLHAEARSRAEREIDVSNYESKTTKHRGAPGFASSSIAHGRVESELSVPLPKLKKKSIISSFSLSQRDFQPKKLIAAKKISTVAPPPNPPIWCRKQAVKKSRKSICVIEPLIPIKGVKVPASPVFEICIHCVDPECCCHKGRGQDVTCKVCKDNVSGRRSSAPRKKSSIISRLPLNPKRYHQTALRHRLMGKTTIRMNSEPLLGRRTSKKKLVEEQNSSAIPPQQQQPQQRISLIPRRDFGPAASNPRPPLLKQSRGTWGLKPEEDTITEIRQVKNRSGKSHRRHSAPPVSSPSFQSMTSLAELAEKGTISLHVWKLVSAHFKFMSIDTRQRLKYLRLKKKRRKKRRRRCCWCGRHKDSVIDEVGEDLNILSAVRQFQNLRIETIFFCHRDDEPVPRRLMSSTHHQIAFNDPVDTIQMDRSIFLACVCNPSIPDPAYDRNFSVFWMETGERLFKAEGKKQVLHPDSRYMLRKLDRFLAFPEESALMLRDFEHNLFGGCRVFDLLAGISENLTREKSTTTQQALIRFHKIVGHFYLVSEWIVHVIISQGTRSGRRSVLNCLLRLAQVSWNIGNLNGVMEILLGLRSPALKPLWLSFSEGDPENLFFINLFKKFFSFASKGYHLQVKRFEEKLSHQKVESSCEGLPIVFVPAFLLHISELALIFQSGHTSSIVIMEDSEDTSKETASKSDEENGTKANVETRDHESVPKATLLSDFKGENHFIRRIGPDGLSNPLKLKRFQSSIELADKAVSLQNRSRLRTHSSSLRKKSSNLTSTSSCLDLFNCSPRSNLPNHDVVMAEVTPSLEPSIEILHRGTTVLHLEPDTHQVTSVLLKLEPCNGTITWCRPPWTDPRKMFGSPTGNDSSGSGSNVSGSNPVSSIVMNSSGANGIINNPPTIDNFDGGNSVSPGLRLKYTNRSGESLAYCDEGYIDLTHVKNLSLVTNIVSYAEEVRVQAQRCFQGVVEPKALRIVYGSTLADNKILTFLCPPKVASAWMESLLFLTKSIKSEDPRMVWLKNQYLFLYYQDDLCMGPLAADAIKVFGGRSWSLTGMLKDRSNKGSWKGGQNPRLKKKSYGNIHSINDRGIHEIFESFGGAGGGPGGNVPSGLSGTSAPTSPWSSPKMGRKSVVTMAPSSEKTGGGRTLSPLQHFDSFASDDNGKLKTFRTGSVTHGSELTFNEFLDLFKSFSLRLRNDIRTLFANHSVCNAISPEGLEADFELLQEKFADQDLEKQRAFLCSLTRNSSLDLKDFKGRSDKKKIYDAISAASIFHNVAREATSRTRVLPLDAFLHFLGHFQKENFTEDEAKKLIEVHEPDPVLRSRHHFSFNGFARYLMDSNNSAVIEEPDEEDLDQPLSRYYIATSHNTYLSGHQLKGQSSVQLYREILLSGCRCVELDCWDGDDGQPIIYHGHTLTTKISFREVVQTISTYAFVSSPLPVILSIENRCSVGQQQKMAAIFKELLGDRLVTAPLSDYEQWLPSPNQLRNKFVLKNKKIRIENNSTRGSLYRASTLDDSVEVDEEYDSDFGEEHYDDECVDDVIEQNLTVEEYHRQSVRRPRTLSISPSMQLSGTSASGMPTNLATPYQPHHRASVFAAVAPTLSSTSSVDLYDGGGSALGSSTKQHKKQNLQIARELSDLIVYCQSVKFKGFRKSGPISTNSLDVTNFWTNYTDSPATRRRVIMEMSSSSSTSSTQLQIPQQPPLASGAMRKTVGAKSGETTPFSSTNSLSSLPNSSRLGASAQLSSSGVSGGPAGPNDILINPIYQCMSLPESRAKTLSRKQPQRMLEHTELQLVRVYPAGMRIDSSNFNPIPFWSCGIQMAAMNYQTITDANMHLHNSFFAGTQGYILRPAVTWNPTHVLYQRFIPSSKSQDGLHPTNITLTVVSGQYVCRENYGASPMVEIEVVGLPRDCSKYKTKMASRNALNPIWEETFELEISLPQLAFIRFNVVDVASNTVTAQRVVPACRLRPGYRHLRLHNEQDQPLPLSQLFICSQIDSDIFSPGMDGKPPDPEQLGRKRMSFLVVHDISEQTPYAILKVPEDATTRDVIRQAVAKAGALTRMEHDYVLLEEVVSVTSSPQQQQQRMVGMEEMPLQVRKADTKFVLKKVGQDPSWRARLGNLMSENRPVELESQQSKDGGGSSSKEDSFEYPDENEDPASDNNTPEETCYVKRNNADQFLVCVFNVSSKVSYSILQVPKTSTAFDVIVLALHKSRRDEKDRPENFVLVEETDIVGAAGNSGGSGSKGSSTKRLRRLLDSKENVYLVQLSWKGAARLVLEEKVRTTISSLHPNAYESVYQQHPNVCETQSDPVGGSTRLSPSGAVTAKMSPNLRRHSRNIVSNVRKLSRSFYGGAGVEPVTLTKVDITRGQSSDPETPISGDRDSDSGPKSETSPQMSRTNSRKMSKINLKKLKIW